MKARHAIFFGQCRTCGLAVIEVKHFFGWYASFSRGIINEGLSNGRLKRRNGSEAGR